MTRTATLLLASVTLLCCAQQSPVRGAQYYALVKQARELSKDKPAEAAAIYERLTRSYPDDAEIWLRLARRRSAGKQYRGAAEAYNQAIARGGEYDGIIGYQVARNYALLGDRDQTFAALEKALAMPIENRPSIANDSAFAAWRNDARFRLLAGLSDATSLSREDRWNRDLDFLRAEIRRMHYPSRHGEFPKGLEDEIRRLRARLPQLSDAMMIPEIQRVMARIGDGHSALQEPSPRVPLSLYQFSDGVFVTDAPADCQCIGERLVSIGGTPVEKAMQQLEPFLSVDNAMGYKRSTPLYLLFPDFLRAAGVIAADQEVVYKFADRSYVSRQFDESYAGTRLYPSKRAGAGPVPRYMQRMHEAYWFESLDGGRTVYFQFNAVMNSGSESIAQFAPKLRQALLASNVRNLIIDVRHNSGGNLNLFNPLFRAIVAFEESKENTGLYLLTGRETFSAAQVFCNVLNYYANPVVAGEPSASKPNFVGESATTKLPYSGLLLTISTRYHQSDDQDSRTWIAPKIPVELSSADYFANRDPALDAVLQVIAASPYK